MNFAGIVDSIPYILKGLGITLQVVTMAGLLGFVIGTLLALCKIGRVKALSFIADAYTSIFRGTPLVLQLTIIYYGFPQMFDIVLTPVVAAVMAFGLNSGAYISEVIRAGINAVDKGQKEAAMALGVPYRQMMKDIILPQALKNILPALVNEYITLTKESAVVTIIGLADIMRRAMVVGANTFLNVEALLFAGAIYYVLVMILTLFGKWLERRLRKSD